MASPQSVLETYAAQMGWQLRKCNVFVEGDSDREMFDVASRLHEQETAKRLCGVDLAVHSIGTGDEGGTPGMLEQFPTLRNLSDASTDAAGKRSFRVVALVDGDPAGKGAARAMVRGHRRLRIWQDVFYLQHRLPRKTTQLPGLEKHIDDANATWKALSTEIEDLVDERLVMDFLARNPAYRCRPVVLGGMRHHGLPLDAKASFLRFVTRNAIYKDVHGLVEALRSLRFYVGLDPEGDDPP